MNRYLRGVHVVHRPVRVDSGSSKTGTNPWRTWDEDAVDLLVRFGEVKESSDLVARSLGTPKLVVCASPAYLQAAGTPASMLALREHKCIVGYRRGQPLS